MLQVRANPDSEAGKMPSRELVADMGRFNEEMIKAGIMLAGEGPASELERRSRVVQGR